jgi:hypothetical protein
VSTPATSAYSSPRTRKTLPPIRLTFLLAEDATSFVWLGRQAGAEVVVKISKRRGSGLVKQEVEMLSKLTGYEDDIILPKGAYETVEGRVVIVMEYGGEAPREWRDLSFEDRYVSIPPSLSSSYSYSPSFLLFTDTTSR